MFRSLLYASSTHIDNPVILDLIEAYVEGCLEPILGQVSPTDLWLKSEESNYTRLWQRFVDTRPFGGEDSCLELRRNLELRLSLWANNSQEASGLLQFKPSDFKPAIPELENYDWVSNAVAANGLLNHIYQMEGHARSHKENPRGAEFNDGPGTWQWVAKFFSVESWEWLLFGKENAGSLSAGRKAEELSKVMKLAPEIKGRVLFYLIGSFPLWLFFCALQGRFGPLLFWLTCYFSVVMWEPLWTLSYNLMQSQIRAGEIMKVVAEIGDSVSIASVALLNERVNWMIQAYVYTQIGIAGIVLSSAVWMSKGWLGENEGRVPGIEVLRKIV